MNMKRTTKEFYDEYYKKIREVSWREQEEVERRMRDEWYHEMEVGDHCHICHYSDVSPVTIIKKTANTLTVRFDKATRNPNWKPEFEIGGFSAVCTNIDTQQWDIEEDENGSTEVFRWSKRYNQYRNTCGEKLFPEWMKYYDYNF